MKVRLSQNAADYVRQEAAYLRRHSRAAAERFLDRIRSVRRDLADFAEAGFSDDGLPVPNLRRFIRDGCRTIIVLVKHLSKSPQSPVPSIRHSRLYLRTKTPISKHRTTWIAISDALFLQEIPYVDPGPRGTLATEGISSPAMP